jgi:hypothetical protein
MATINVATSQNLSAVTYTQGDTINVLDGVTLTINSQWSIKPYLIQALGTGRIEVSNSSTSVLHLQEFYVQNGLSAGGFSTTQNGVLQVRGDWITVGTSTGANNQILFSANNIGGVAIDYPTMIQVETGSGTNVWEVWQAIPLDVSGGTVNTLGFNALDTTAGTVAVSAAGVVTGTGTAFTSLMAGLPFKLPSIARDFVISAFTSATQITIQELDGSTYTGGVIAAGTSYILRSGSLISSTQVGSGDLGKVLFFNPVTTAVSMGDGTNGTKIPTGARVRIPNIHFNGALQQTTLTAAITSTAAQALTLAAAIGPTTNGTYTPTYVGSLLLVNGSTVERIYYSTRSGTTVSATGMVRGVYGTTAQTSFPIGTLVYWLAASNLAVNNNIPLFNTNASGTVDIQVCSVGTRMQSTFTNFASATIKNFGSVYFSLNSSAGTYDVDGLSVLGGGYQSNGFVLFGVSFSSLIGGGTIKNVHQNTNYYGGSNASGVALINVQNAQSISNIRSRLFNRTSGVSVNVRAINFTTVKCATPVDGLYFNGQLVTQSVTNIDIKNIYFSALPNANSTGSSDGAYPLYLTSTVNSTFRGIQIWNGGLATRQALVITDSGCDSVVIHNKGYSAINAVSQLSSIINDGGLNTIAAWISITNPRTSAVSSYLRSDITTNSNGLFRMLLIDSIVTTTTGTGGNAKGGVELDMIAGSHRLFSSTTTASIVPNLVDVQPIVVLSNTAKTTGSVYVGAFSAQNQFDMYTFTGGTYLDNLGRIYYPAIGNSVVIKSVYALKGITNFTGTAFDFNYNLGAGTNPIPAGTTVEFRMTNWGTPNTGAWTTFTNNANLETARAALTGYSSSVGLDLQFRITGTTAVAGRYLMSMKLPVTIDASYNPPVYSTNIGVTGAQIDTLIAGYLNAAPATPLLQSNLVLTGSSGSIPMPYDYDAVPVDYRLIARKAGWTFSNLVGNYLKQDISIPITQLQVMDVNGNPLYASGVTGVAVNYGTSKITLSANRSAKQIWSAIQDSLSLLANLTQADPFSTSNGAAFYSTYTLEVAGTLTDGNIVGNLELTGALAAGVTITGNVSQTTPTNLNGITINGNLTFNTNTPITITLTNCSISGTVSNNGSGLVTINLTNSTIGSVGANVASRLTTSLTINGLIAGSQIYIANAAGTQVDYVSSSGTSYTLDTTGGTGTWTYKVARYGYTSQSGNHSPATASTTVSINLITDAFITEATKATVAAYTTLENPDKIYDYASYFETTNAGILIDRIISKSATYASAGSYPLILTNTGAIWNLAGGILTLRITTAFVGGSTITGGLITSNSITHNAQPITVGNWGVIAGNNITLLSTNFQPLIATTSIFDLQTIGSISEGGSIDFGSNSNIILNGNLQAANTTFSGILNLNSSFDTTFDLTDCVASSFTINGTGIGIITVRCYGSTDATTITAGANVIILRIAPITAPNLLAGSRVRLYNVTDSVEIYNNVLSSSGFSYNYFWTANKTIKLTATYQNGTTAKLTVEAVGVVTTSGLQFLNSQEDDTIYNAYALNGSSITKFQADYVNDEIDLKIATDFLATELYAWWVYNLTTINGIRDFVGGITAQDAANLRINTNIISIKLDNITASDLLQTDNIRIYRSDLVYPVARPTSGGGGINVNWQNQVYVADLDSSTIKKIFINTNALMSTI